MLKEKISPVGIIYIVMVVIETAKRETSEGFLFMAKHQDRKWRQLL